MNAPADRGRKPEPPDDTGRPAQPDPSDGVGPVPPASRLYRAFQLVAGDEPPTDPTPFLDAAREAGVIDKRVILQTTWWVDVRSGWHRLTDMAPDYRANVLAYLEQQAPTWTEQAVTWTLYEALTGATSVTEASDRLDLLDLLTPGWTGQTPLGRRLHQLNGTTPDPLPPARVLRGAADSDTPDHLRDDDRGCWQITTASTSRYLLDLDERRILRHPGADPGAAAVYATNGDRAPAARWPVAQLDHDGEWTGLAGLVHCRVGRPLVAVDVRPSGPGYRLSTPITHIQRLTRPEAAAPSDDPGPGD